MAETQTTKRQRNHNITTRSPQQQQQASGGPQRENFLGFRTATGSFLLTTILIISYGGHAIIQATDACRPVYFGPRSEKNIACQCDQHYCDSLKFRWPADDDKFVQVISSKSGSRFQVSEFSANDIRQRHEDNNSKRPDLLVDVQINHRRQHVVGFGGAVTDSAAQNIMDLPERVSKSAFEDYFGPNGLDYNMVRVPCGGTDMSRRIYTYDDMPDGEEDFELRHFALQPEDLEYKIPFLHRVNSMRASRHLPPVKVMSAPWTPPAWMKTNSKIMQGYLKGDHSGPYYDAYARYLLRFLDEYERHNISFWAISGQNEPYTTRRVGISFNSMNFLPEQLADYNEFNLIPALERANRTADKLLLFLFDDNLNGHEPFTEQFLKRPRIMKFARGLARHWYIKDQMPYVELSIARLHYPHNFIGASTEASFISLPAPGNWNRGELYALDVMENLLAGFGVWIDWNLALDMGGGPTWVGNYLDAAMLVDPKRNIYYKNPMYYVLGHISRFIRPNSRLISTGVYPVLANGTVLEDGSANLSRNLERDKRPVSVVAAELDPDDPVVGDGERPTGRLLRRRFGLVALNRASESKRVELRLSQCRAGKGRAQSAKDGQLLERAIVLDLAANSITSLAFNC